MIVVAKHHFLRPSVVIADGTRYRVRREGLGAFRVARTNPEYAGRLIYRKFRDQASIDRPEGRLDIRFEERETEFAWDRHTYRLGDMLDGDIRIREQDLLVVEGRVTVSGVRLRTLISDLDPVIRELAFVLALRSEDVRRFAPNEAQGGP